MELHLDDIITLKKPHPCGSSEWRVLRVGMDIRLECLGCGHLVLKPRRQLERSIKKICPPTKE